MTAQLKAAITASVVMDDEEYALVCRALEPSFVDHFHTLGIMKTVLRELVYGIDHLRDLVEMPECPANKTVVTVDLEHYKLESFFLFDQLFRATNNECWKIKLPTPGVKKALDEFFAKRYIETFHFLMARMELEELTFKVDHIRFSIEFNEIIPDSKLFIFHFTNLDTKESVNLPFARHRTQHSLKVKRND
jgi:hypothetical protein